MQLEINNTLGEWASNYAAASMVFMRHDLDFCCGGSVSLKQACQQKDIKAEAIVEEIISASADKQCPKWNSMEVGDIVDDILELFHKKHREDLQLLIPLARKVETVHADRSDSPQGLADFLQHLAFELDSHMQKEEMVLFPMIKSGNGKMAQGPIQVMMHEHIGHGENLLRLKQLANDYVLPVDACGSWNALYHGVAQLEMEIKQHIATENNVLFPKVLNS